MNRRGFLACLGLAPVVAVVPLAAAASPAGVGANFLNDLLQQMRRAIRGPGPAILYGADGVPIRLVYEHSIDALTGAVTIYDVRSIEMGGEEK